MATTCYLKKRSSTLALKNQTSLKALFGKKQDMSYVRVFGCEAYVPVSKEKRNRLESKLEKSIFIRYKDGVKRYKMWNPNTKPIIYSRDAMFKGFTTNHIVPQALEKPQTVEFDVNLKKRLKLCKL